MVCGLLVRVAAECAHPAFFPLDSGHIEHSATLPCPLVILLPYIGVHFCVDWVDCVGNLHFFTGLLGNTQQYRLWWCCMPCTLNREGKPVSRSLSNILHIQTVPLIRSLYRSFGEQIWCYSLTMCTIIKKEQNGDDKQHEAFSCVWVQGERARMINDLIIFCKRKSDLPPVFLNPIFEEADAQWVCGLHIPVQSLAG